MINEFEKMDPYQQLVMAEEYYSRTLEIGRSIPKDEASQDMYMASLDEARCVLNDAKKYVAEYEAELADQETEYERNL